MAYNLSDGEKYELKKKLSEIGYDCQEIIVDEDELIFLQLTISGKFLETRSGELFKNKPETEQIIKSFMKPGVHVEDPQKFKFDAIRELSNLGLVYQDIIKKDGQFVFLWLTWSGKFGETSYDELIINEKDKSVEIKKILFRYQQSLEARQTSDLLKQAADALTEAANAQSMAAEAQARMVELLNRNEDRKLSSDKRFSDEIKKIIMAIEKNGWHKLSFEALVDVTKIKERRLRTLFDNQEFCHNLSGIVKRKSNTAKSEITKSLWLEWYKLILERIAKLAEKSDRNNTRNYGNMDGFASSEEEENNY